MEIKKVSKILTNHKWSIQGFNGTPLYLLYASAATGWMLKKTFGHDYTHFFYLCPTNRVHMYYDEEDWELLGNDYFKKVKNIKSFKNLKIIYWKKFSNSLKSKDKYYSILSQKTPTNDELVNYARVCGNVLVQSVGFSHIIEAISFVSEQKLIEILKSKNAYFQKNLQLLTSPVYPSFLSKTQKALWKIKKARGETQKKLISRFLKKYFWFENSYVAAKFLTAGDILQRAQKMEKFPMAQSFGKIKEDKKILLNKLSFSKNERFVVQTIEETSRWQDDRKKNILMSLGVLEQALIKLSECFSIELGDLKCIIPEEINKKNLQNKKFRQNLSLRHKGCAYYATAKTTKIFTGSDYFRFLKMEKNMHRQTVTELKGVVAQKGKVVGKVKICSSLKDINEIKTGSILITSMTRPEFLPAMRKAAGFITDEGGITSHAAIIAREMKKPCVIGTKIATKIFKDGDIIEVNANIGIIKLIKN